MEQEQDRSRKGQDWGSALICLVHLGQPPPLWAEASHMLMGVLVEAGLGHPGLRWGAVRAASF